MKNKIMLMAVVAAFLGSIALVGCGDQPAATGDGAKKPETSTKAPDTTTPETKAPETKAPETKAPDAAAPAGAPGTAPAGAPAGAPGEAPKTDAPKTEGAK